MNAHDIDPAALAAEADAVPLPELGPDLGAGQEAAAPPPSPWASMTPGFVEALAVVVLPSWGLAAEEKAAVADALAPVLDDIFPGGLGAERWAPYLRLVLVGASVAAAHRDPETGRWPPLFVRPEAAAPAKADRADHPPA